QVSLEDAQEALRDLVRVLDECFPLVQNDIEGHAEVCESGPGVDESTVRDSDLTILGRLDHAEGEGSLHELAGHRALGKPGEQFGGVEHDGVNLSEQRVEFCFDADHRVEAASSLP